MMMRSCEHDWRKMRHPRSRGGIEPSRATNIFQGIGLVARLVGLAARLDRLASLPLPQPSVPYAISFSCRTMSCTSAPSQG
jgi:hypothetical protein